MPNGMYEKYMGEMAKRAERGDISLVDLNSLWIFQDRDFQDTAHLNGDGASKFMKLLAMSLAKNERVREALAMTGSERVKTAASGRSSLH